MTPAKQRRGTTLRQAGRRVAVVGAVGVLTGVLGGAVALADERVHADFNGDGFTDLAVGVPSEGVGIVSGAGAVNVIYGAAMG